MCAELDTCVSKTLIFTLLHQTDEFHMAVPFPILTGKILIVSLQNITFITEIFNHSAMRKSSTWGGVAGVAPVLWLIWRLAGCSWKEGNKYNTHINSDLHNDITW